MSDDETPGVSAANLVRGRGAMKAVRARLQPDGRLDATDLKEKVRTGHVYVIALDEPFARLRGTSDVLYIGEGSSGRVNALIDGGHSANRSLARIAQVLGEKTVHIHVRETTEHQLFECAMLVRYFVVHGEMPPCNSRWEGWVAGRTLRAIAKRAAKQADWWVPFPVYDWPYEQATASFADLHYDLHAPGRPKCPERPAFSLGWVWPTSWTGSKELKEVECELVLLIDGDGSGDLDWRDASLFGSGWEGYSYTSLRKADFLQCDSDQHLEALITFLEKGDAEEVVREVARLLAQQVPILELPELRSSTNGAAPGHHERGRG